MTSSGFVALAGRPNVGKSTFLNAVVGQKVAIVSDRPQTTRRAIRGVARHDGSELVFVDLPGVQRPRDLLGERMASTVESELSGADAALLVLNGEQGVGAGDRYIAEALRAAALPVTIAVNKLDRVDRARTAAALLSAEQLLPGREVFPISAWRRHGLQPLLSHLAQQLPEGEPAYPEQQSSDQPLQLLLAELIREAAIRRTFDELPHALEVAVEEVARPRDGLARVTALIWVETESQKRIVVGARGKMVKAIGIAGRREIERELRCRVHLELTVRVRRDWRGEAALLDRLGIG
ncbi:MAG: GTPase Era [Solirubrobacteraceae bacterium]